MKRIFLKNGDFEADKNTRDEALLTMTAQVLATERTQPQLIVLHLMGSHPQACDRTQGKIRDVCPVERRRLVIYTP
ncbi:Putative integral membrane protein [Salmonella enterica subsp. enterica]|nr:Putative integral membrane protein [Salmonella enterica subsp. enterica]